MSALMMTYLSSWITWCVLAAVLGVETVRPRGRDVVAFLGAPWKVLLFAPAVFFVTFAGRFTDDETWDVVTGGGMSGLTVATAWWSVGTAVRVVRRQRPFRELVIASAVTLFSSSWFYDGYLLLRDGAYTRRWVGNLMLSPIIYVCAGLILNLELREGTKLAFAFTRPDWPRPVPTRAKTAWPLLLVSLPLIAIAAYCLVGFVGWDL